MPGTASLEAKQRRVERGIRDKQLTAQVFLALLIWQLPKGKLLLSLDRTTWEHGDHPMNLLVLGAVVQGFTVPLLWIALDHTGNSDTLERIWLLTCLLKALPAHRWQGVVADREFIGREWFRFLRKVGIRRAIRIKKDARIDGLRADQWFEGLEVGKFQCLAERLAVYGEVMRVVATRSPKGDLVIIATDFTVWVTWQLYQQRWSVECTFSSLKSRGFDLERTAVTAPARLECLFGHAVLAWLQCLKLGHWLDQLKPIPLLAHGRKAMSLVRSGAMHLQNALHWLPDRFAQFIAVLLQPFPAPGESWGEVVPY